MINMGRHTELSEFRVYGLDMSSLTMRHLTTVSRPHRDSTIKNGIMVIGWAEGGHYYLDIRKLPCHDKEIEKSVLVDLGLDIVSCLSQRAFESWSDAFFFLGGMCNERSLPS